MENFTGLNCWKEAREFRNQIFTLQQNFPSFEKYKLKDQIVRSSRSVCANIAEGYGRYHYKENIQFCRQARGSLHETLDHLLCALDCNYIDSNLFNRLKADHDNILRLINGYIAYLKRRIEATN